MSSTVGPEARVLALAAEPRRWLWLFTGVVWTIAALVILQFDAASVTTVSVIVGCMFLLDERGRQLRLRRDAAASRDCRDAMTSSALDSEWRSWRDVRKL